MFWRKLEIKFSKCIMGYGYPGRTGACTRKGKKGKCYQGYLEMKIMTREALVCLSPGY